MPPASGRDLYHSSPIVSEVYHMPCEHGVAVPRNGRRVTNSTTEDMLTVEMTAGTARRLSCLNRKAC